MSDRHAQDNQPDWPLLVGPHDMRTIDVQATINRMLGIPPATGTGNLKEMYEGRRSAGDNSDRPGTLAELAAIVRRDNPRQVQVAGLLEYMNDHTSAAFDDLKDKVHGSIVEDETVKANIKRSRIWIRQKKLPIRLVISGRKLFRRAPSE